METSTATWRSVFSKYDMDPTPFGWHVLILSSLRPDSRLLTKNHSRQQNGAKSWKSFPTQRLTSQRPSRPQSLQKQQLLRLRIRSQSTAIILFTPTRTPLLKWMMFQFAAHLSLIGVWPSSNAVEIPIFEIGRRTPNFESSSKPPKVRIVSLIIPDICTERFEKPRSGWG